MQVMRKRKRRIIQTLDTRFLTAVNDDKSTDPTNAISDRRNDLVQPAVTNRRANLCPILLTKTHTTCQPRKNQPLPFTLPPKSLDRPQPSLAHREGGFRLPQTLPKAIPRHRRVDPNIGSEFPRRRTYNLRVAVIFENESLDIADCEAYAGDGLVGGRSNQN